ncbi:HAD family phosphatase [Jannaschia formosa]|nr:HAD family phosphatase [Jannaschia formosa]
MSAVVFDIGGVLVDWKPHLAWSPELGEQGAREFMDRIGFAARNLRGDGGATFAEMAAELDDPEDARLLAAYPSLYVRTVRDAVPGTWAVLDELQAAGVATHAITNWSAETWPEGLKAHPRLAEVFGTLVVSGREGMVKPDPRIFRLLCDRAGLAPEACVFVDDGLHNVEGARAVGMDGIHFSTAEAFRAALVERGLL